MFYPNALSCYSENFYNHYSLGEMLWNRGFLCFDKESEVNVKLIPMPGKNKRTERVPFKCPAEAERLTISLSNCPEHFLRHRLFTLAFSSSFLATSKSSENFASKRFFYDTTEDVIEDVLKWDIEAFPSIKESKFYHDEQLTEHTLSRMEGAYKELLDNLEVTFSLFVKWVPMTKYFPVVY